MNPQKLMRIKSVLAAVYGEYDIDGRYTEPFARSLYECVTDGEVTGLDDIIPLTYNFEQSVRAAGVDMDVSYSCIVFERMVELLDVNGKWAELLTENFTVYHDVVAFDRLMTDFRRFLSDGEENAIMEIAKSNFEKSVWICYERRG